MPADNSSSHPPVEMLWVSSQGVFPFDHSLERAPYEMFIVFEVTYPAQAPKWIVALSSTSNPRRGGEMEKFLESLQGARSELLVVHSDLDSDTLCFAIGAGYIDHNKVTHWVSSEVGIYTEDRLQPLIQRILRIDTKSFKKVVPPAPAHQGPAGRGDRSKKRRSGPPPEITIDSFNGGGGGGDDDDTYRDAPRKDRSNRPSRGGRPRRGTQK